VLLLLVVRPNLSGEDQASFPYWARLDEDGIRACTEGDSRAARVRVLSTIAVTKFTRLRHAVHLSLAALALLVLAAAGTHAQELAEVVRELHREADSPDSIFGTLAQLLTVATQAANVLPADLWRGNFAVVRRRWPRQSASTPHVA
jgi:hypothetical protein